MHLRELKEKKIADLVEIGKEHALHLRVRVEKRDEMLRKLPRADDADFDAHGRRLSPGSPLGFNANPAD